MQRNIALLLAPMAPYLAHELWEMTGETSNLLKAPWPKYDAALAAEDEIEIPVQVNGKLRSVVVVPAGATDDQIKQAALADEKVQRGDCGQADREGDRRAKEAGEYRGAIKCDNHRGHRETQRTSRFLCVPCGCAFRLVATGLSI